jgi:hypothetical protein
MPLLQDSAEVLSLAMRPGPGDSSAYGGDTRVSQGAAHCVNMHELVLGVLAAACQLFKH